MLDVREQVSRMTPEKWRNLIGGRNMVVIDEAQRIEDIGLALKILIDNVENVRVVVTGSSAFDLRNRTYEPLTDEWTEGASGSFTDRNLMVSQQFYYKVVAETDHPTFGAGTIESAPVAFRRARRLERAWSDETKLLDGITIMQPTNGNWSAVSTHWKRPYDGNATSFPDTGSTEYSKGPIGLNFGERVWVTGFGYVCRNDNDGYLRISTTALYAASGDKVFRRTLRIGASDPVKRSKPTAPGYDDGFWYAREHEPVGGIGELLGSWVMSGRIRGAVSVVVG